MAKLKSQAQKYVELKEEDYLRLIENTIKMEALKIAGIEKDAHLQSNGTYPRTRTYRPAYQARFKKIFLNR